MGILVFFLPKNNTLNLKNYNAASKTDIKYLRGARFRVLINAHENTPDPYKATQLCTSTAEFVGILITGVFHLEKRAWLRKAILM